MMIATMMLLMLLMLMMVTTRLIDKPICSPAKWQDYSKYMNMFHKYTKKAVCAVLGSGGQCTAKPWNFDGENDS